MASQQNNKNGWKEMTEQQATQQAQQQQQQQTVRDGKIVKTQGQTQQALHDANTPDKESKENGGNDNPKEEALTSMTAEKAKLVKWGTDNHIRYEAIAGFDSFYSMFTTYGTDGSKFIADVELEYGKLTSKQKQSIGNLFAAFTQYQNKQSNGMQ